MIEIVEVREMACRLCGYIKRLRKDELEPTSCPACQDGTPMAFKSERPFNGWTA